MIARDFSAITRTSTHGEHLERCRRDLDPPNQTPGNPTVEWIAAALLEHDRKVDSMAKKSAPKCKPIIPGQGPKPAGMKQPPSGRAKMVNTRAKASKKSR
jgi:hypothetical protein